MCPPPASPVVNHTVHFVKGAPVGGMGSKNLDQIFDGLGNWFAFVTHENWCQHHNFLVVEAQHLLTYCILVLSRLRGLVLERGDWQEV